MAVVRSNQHDKPVVGAIWLHCEAPISHSQVEDDSIGRLYSITLADEPISTINTYDIKVCMTVEDIGIRTKTPWKISHIIDRGGQSLTIHNLTQQAIFEFPTLRSRSGVEAFVIANHIIGASIADVVARHVDGACPAEVGLPCGKVVDGQVERHGASVEGGEGYRFAPRAVIIIAAFGTDTGIILRFSNKARKLKILMRGGRFYRTPREIRIFRMPSETVPS